ncbi:MAG: hypothetical protein Q9187_007197 [Circinaria calcarea]
MSMLDHAPLRSQSRFYQPPTTPSISGSLLSSAQSINSTTANSNTSRKRSRHDDSTDLSAYSFATPSGWSTSNTPGFASPSPFVNTRYRLAGDLDTPTAAIALSYNENVYGANTSDQTYRRGSAWSNGTSAISESYFPQLSALSREGNGRKRGFDERRTQIGWGKTVFTAFGGVAGKVWEFCTAGAFRGFYAGGGPGYALNNGSPEPISIQSSTCQDDDEKSNSSKNIAITTVPGGFPDSDFIDDYISHPDQRPKKRLHRDKDPVNLRSSWVLINPTSLSRDTSPTRRKTPLASTPSTRHSHRRPILPASRPSYAGSPALRSPDRPASLASTRSPISSPSRTHHSPQRHHRIPYRRTNSSASGTATVMSPEAVKLAAQIRRRDEEGERELGRFNKRLKDMIREGKEALGSKVEVFEEEEEEVVDEGFVDGDGHEDGKW